MKKSEETTLQNNNERFNSFLSSTCPINPVGEVKDKLMLLQESWILHTWITADKVHG